MNALPRRETAKIYPFPRRARPSSETAARSDRSAPSQAGSACDVAGAWYHEAAIRDDLRDRKS